MPNVEFIGKLTIDLEIGGKNAEEIIGIYEASIMDDINQTAWNLCECNDQIQLEKFSNLTKINYEIKPTDHYEATLSTSFRVTGNDPDFLENVISEYMDGFDDWIRSITNGYYSRTGSRVGTDIKVINWNLEIEKNNSSIAHI